LKARYLVTTADERTWPEDSKTPVLFLGEWCRLYSRRAVWEKLDSAVVPYHWDDREKLHRDYKALQSLYEEVLQELGGKLNEIHNVDYSVRYWRIFLGPWLGYFMQMLFDRWAMVERTLDQYEVVGVRILNTPPEALIPNDMVHFNGLYVEDLWNEGVYGQLLKQWTHVPVEEVEIQNSETCFRAEEIVLERRRRFKRKLFNAYCLLSGILAKDNEVFLKSEYLTLWDGFLLQLRLGQIPKRWDSPSTLKAQVEWSQRQWQLVDGRKNRFADILRASLPLHIPTLYLEGYQDLQNQLEDLPWPKRPRLIFTSNSYNSDDIFKAWAAKKVEAGAPLIIGQHGGHYGVGLWSFSEEHETKISDRYLSWGWEEDIQPKVKAVGQLKARHPLGVHHAQQPDALLVTAVVPRYSYWMYSIMVASQWLGYLKDQFRFVENLPQAIRDALVVRLYPKDYGWDQIARWQDRFPNIRLDAGEEDLDHLIRLCRLYISTYNASTFLESFTMNVPTVIFWNPNHWELRNSAVSYFEDLKRVGIFHENPESAARHVTAIWNDVDAWWLRGDVQAVREHFCRRYSYLPNDLVRRVEKALREMIQERSEKEGQALVAKKV